MRVLDRLVAAADEDAFEAGNLVSSGDDDNNGTSNINADQPSAFGGGANLSLSGRIKSNRRRSSSANSLSVSFEADIFMPFRNESALAADT